MAMLAERKRKQKWSLNPRGKEWSQDANKFGQKMLEKMGWQHGKGLGANEDGITEHVKVSYKNDSKGMGFKESNDQWTEHETHFSALLESLSGAAGRTDETKLNSLEKKSQTSRVRVHYHKFTRGKDLSRYSEKDLANIFGKKSLKEPKQEAIKEENPSGSMEKLEKDSKFLLNAGSMKDYFKKKLPNFGKSNGFVIGSNGVLKKGDSDSEADVRPSFGLKDEQYSGAENSYAGFGYKNEVKSEDVNYQLNDNLEQKQGKETFVSYINGDKNTETKKEKLKKKRRIEDYNEHSILSPKKKSKKNGVDVCNRQLKNAAEVDLGMSNPAFNPLSTPVEVQRHVLTTIEEIVHEETSFEENSLQAIEKSAEVRKNEDDKNETPKKQKKKKKTTSENCNGIEVSKEESETEFCNTKSQQDGLEYSMSDASLDNVGNCQKSNKKKKKVNMFAIDNPNFEDASQEPEERLQIENAYEVRVKEKKKKKKKTASENCNGIEVSKEEPETEFCNTKSQKNDLEYSMSDASLQNVGNCQRSNKKKKKVNMFAIDNPNFEDALQEPEECLQIENTYEVRVKEKKKKKKTKSVDENVSCDGTIEDSVDSSEIKANQHDVSDTGKKKKQKLAPENSSSNASTDNSADFSQTEKVSYEVKKGKKKQKRKFALENPSFNGTTEDSADILQTVENPYEEKRIKALAVENLGFDDAQENSVEFSQMEDNPYEVKVTEKKKKQKRKFALENPSFNGTVEDSADNGETVDNPYEEKRTKALALENPSFDAQENPADFSQIEENPYEVKVTEKKKRKKNHLAIENPAFNDSPDISTDFSQVEDNQFEIVTEKNKKKKKKQKYAIDNPQFNPSDSLDRCEKLEKASENETQDSVTSSTINLYSSQSEVKEDISINVEATDLMLNVITTPVVSKINPVNSEDTFSSIKRRKSVRFSNITQERIIPNNDDLRNVSDIEGRNELFDINTQVLNSSLQHQNSNFNVATFNGDPNHSKKRKVGLDNMAFNKQQNNMDENVDFISKTLDRYQAEIENDINEKKVQEFRMEDVMVGEVGNSHGENEKLPEGTKLKFRYAHFMARTPLYHIDKTGARKGYKHLIKGDIVVKFNNTNLHEIDGYAVRSKRGIV